MVEEFMEHKVLFLILFLSLASFLFFAILDLSKNSKLLHRYCSIVLLILFIFLNKGFGVFTAILWLSATFYLWRVDERRHKKNEELWAVLSSQNFETVKSYLSAKPNLMVTDRHQKTPVKISLQNGNEKIVELLLLHNAKFTKDDVSLAIRKKFVRAVDIMIEKASWDPRAFLRCAVENNCIGIVQKLLSKGAPWGSGDLSLSLSKQYDQITSLLLEKGAYDGDGLVFAIQNNLTDITNRIINNIPMTKHALPLIDLLIINKCNENYILMILDKIKEKSFIEENSEECLNLLLKALQNGYCEVAKWFINHKIYNKETKLLAMKKGYTHLMERMME